MNQTLSNEEAIFLTSLVQAQEPANVIIPDDIAPADLWKQLGVACKALGKAQEAVTRLKPFIGRFLMLLRNHQYLYEQQGYTNYNDFMTHGVPKLFGISRPEAYNCVKVAETLGFMAPAKMEELKFAKLNIVATALRRDIDEGIPVEMVEAKQDYWVKYAEGHTVQEIKEHMEDKNLIEAGEMNKISIVLSVMPATKEDWDEMIKDPEVRAYCDTDDPGTIFDRMMAECKGEWQAGAGDAERN